MKSAVQDNLGERELAAACSRKDCTAEEELYTRYAARVYSLCRRYSESAEDAEDLLQETFLKVFDSISSFQYRGNGSLYAWISRIAVNTAIDRIRDRVRLQIVPFDSSIQEEFPDNSKEEIERVPHEALLAMITQLSDVRRVVFNLYCIDEYSHKKIGELLGISEKGSAGILAKAKRQLKKQIDRYLKEKDL